MPECWWLDESYPGPQVDPDMELFEVFAQIGRALGVSAQTASRTFAVIGRQYGKAMHQMIDGLKPALVWMDEVYRPETRPNLTKNGPRLGHQFDHRGRRRW